MVSLKWFKYEKFASHNAFCAHMRCCLRNWLKLGIAELCTVWNSLCIGNNPQWCSSLGLVTRFWNRLTVTVTMTVGLMRCYEWGCEWTLTNPCSATTVKTTTKQPRWIQQNSFWYRSLKVEERTSLLNQQGSQHLILCVAKERGRTCMLEVWSDRNQKIIL